MDEERGENIGAFEPAKRLLVGSLVSLMGMTIAAERTSVEVRQDTCIPTDTGPIHALTSPASLP